MKPYEISIWEDRIQQREDLKYINVYPGLNTDLKDLSFWYNEVIENSHFSIKQGIDIENYGSNWNYVQLTGNKDNTTYHRGLNTGISFIKPNQKYTFVFEVYDFHFKNLITFLEPTEVIQINRKNSLYAFEDIWYINCSADSTKLQIDNSKNSGEYKVLIKDDGKSLIFIGRTTSKANFINPEVEIGVYTRLHVPPHPSNNPQNSLSWSANIRQAVYEGHEIFSDFFDNESLTYNDFYNLENKGYYPYFTGEKEYFKEYKIATIGSEKMSAPYRVINPVFNQNINGTSSLSFSMYSKYYDEEENKLVNNPFISYMTNERKIKLKYENKWYDFVIKSVSESSDDYKFDYIAKDLFINELSKIGFNKTFQTELLNNTGTVIELGNEILSGTDWSVDEENSDLLFQAVEDMLYEVVTSTSFKAIKYIKEKSGIVKEIIEIPANAIIMIFYNSLTSQKSSLEFLYNGSTVGKQIPYTSDKNNIISNAHYCICENVKYGENSLPYFDGNLPIFSGEKKLVLDERGERYVSEEERVYYPPLNRYVNVYTYTYKDSNGKEITELRYGYTENEYETTPIVMNLITNSGNFTDTSGWDTSNGKYTIGDSATPVSSRDAKISLEINKINNVNYPGLRLQFGKNSSTSDDTIPLIGNNEIDNTDFQGYLSGHVFNTGFSDNLSFIKELKKGDEFIIRLQLSFEAPNTNTPPNILSALTPILATYENSKIPDLGDNKETASYLVNFCNMPYLGTKGHAYNIYDPNYLVPIYLLKSYSLFNISNIPDSMPLCFVYRGSLAYWLSNANTAGFFEYDGQSNSYYFTKDGYLQWKTIAGYTKKGESAEVTILNKGDFPISGIFELNEGTNKYDFKWYQYLPSFDGEHSGKEFYKYSSSDETWHMLETNTSVDEKDEIKINNDNLIEFLKARNVWKIIELEQETENNKTKKNLSTIEARGKYLGENLDYSKLLTKNIALFLQTMDYHNYATALTIYNIQLYKAYYDSEGNVYTPQEVPGENTRKIYRYFNPNLDENLEVIEASDATPITYEYEGYTPSEKYTQVVNENCIKKNSITATESNCYNLIQKECEIFDCWAKFDIEHENNGEIKLKDYKPIKKVSFKEYVGEDNYAGFKYGINLNSIKRTLDSEQFISKIIVKNNSNEYGKDGFCSIARAKNNPIGENYLLDFTYYINQGLLNKEKTLKDMYEDYYSLLSIRKIQSEKYVEKRKRLSVLVSNLKALYETYKLAVDNTKQLLAEYQDRFSQLTGYSYSYYTKVKKQDSSWESNSTFIDYKTKISYYTRLLSGFKALVNSSKKEYNTALTDYQRVIWAIERISLEKEKLHTSFYNRYSYYIQEGSWISEDYIDDDKYYFEALKTLQTSAMPKVSYTINVSDISYAEDFENYKFKIGDKTYIEDTEFFGWEYIDNIKTPYREEVIVSEISHNLDEPEKTQIKVQNYKTQFEDLFQRMAATVQAVQYGTGKYSNTQTSLSSNNRFKDLNNQIATLQSQIKYLA